MRDLKGVYGFLQSYCAVWSADFIDDNIHIMMPEVWLLLMGFQILSGNLQAGKFDTSVS